MSAYDGTELNRHVGVGYQKLVPGAFMEPVVDTDPDGANDELSQREFALALAVRLYSGRDAANAAVCIAAAEQFIEWLDEPFDALEDDEPAAPADLQH